MKVSEFLDKLVWQKDRMLLNDLVFRLQHYKDDETWDLGDNCFIFFKIRQLIEQYRSFWSQRVQFAPQNILELGMWDGGSLAFWYECFHPERIVGIDFLQKENSAYFQHYLHQYNLHKTVKTYWGINQTDALQLQQIVENDFSENLDLVIDDASHQYAETKRSFEILFPRLRPGGLYIIEDWAWAYWGAYHTMWDPRQALTQLVFELVEATGSSKELIPNISVFEGFVAIERGTIQASDLQDFHLENFITRAPQKSPQPLPRRMIQRCYNSLRFRLGYFKNALKR
jgi:predicted O-methyltransferase YrrM